MQAIFIWGTQLTSQHNSALRQAPNAPVIMIESPAVCRRFTYHTHKLILVLSAMRAFADELRQAGRQVTYIRMDTATHDGLFAQLKHELHQLGADELVVMEQNDRSPQQALQA